MERGKGHICNTTPKFYQIARPTTGRMRAPHRTASASRTEYSYANLPNRSTYDIITYLEKRLLGGSGATYQWVIEGDIASYFDPAL